MKELSPDLLNELFTIISKLKPSIEDTQSQQRAIRGVKEHCCPHCNPKIPKRTELLKMVHKSIFVKIVIKNFLCLSIPLGLVDILIL